MWVAFAVGRMVYSTIKFKFTTLLTEEEGWGINTRCPSVSYYHHENVPPEGMSRKQAEEMVGPSLKSKKRFNEVFGGELVLLEYVNDALEIIKESE